MAIFNSYVKLPEGNDLSLWCPQEKWRKVLFDGAFFM